jgi:hypothetical protein
MQSMDREVSGLLRSRSICNRESTVHGGTKTGLIFVPGEVFPSSSCLAGCGFASPMLCLPACGPQTDTGPRILVNICTVDPPPTRIRLYA